MWNHPTIPLLFRTICAVRETPAIIEEYEKYNHGHFQGNQHTVQSPKHLQIKGDEIIPVKDRLQREYRLWQYMMVYIYITEATNDIEEKTKCSARFALKRKQM